MVDHLGIALRLLGAVDDHFEVVFGALLRDPVMREFAGRDSVAGCGFFMSFALMGDAD